MSGNYIVYGPFEDGSPPGIDSSFLNNVEDFLLTINSAAYDSHISADGSGNATVNSLISAYDKINVSGTVLNGGTAGTATLYQPHRGTYKVALIIINGFRTAGTNQTIALPVAFTTQCFVRSGNLGSATGFNGFQLLSSGSAQPVGLITALSGTGGTNASETTLFGNSLGECFHPVDTIQFVASSGSNTFGSIELIGI